MGFVYINGVLLQPTCTDLHVSRMCKFDHISAYNSDMIPVCYSVSRNLKYATLAVTF